MSDKEELPQAWDCLVAPTLADQVLATGARRRDLHHQDRIVALGGEVVRLVDQSWGEWPELYYQMRDPEGNEFCLQ